MNRKIPKEFLFSSKPTSPVNSTQSKDLISFPQSTKHRKAPSEINSKLQRICNIYSKKKKSGVNPTSAVLMESANFGSLVGTDHLFSEKKIPEAVTLSSRGSLDKRSKDGRPTKISASKDTALVLKKLPKGFRLSAAPSGTHSPRDSVPPKKYQLESHAVAPLRLLRSRKLGGTASALAMRHPSPRTLGSFVSNTNISGSHVGELTRVEKTKKGAIVGPKVQLKRASESQAQLKLVKKPQEGHLKMILNTSKNKKETAPRASSRGADRITGVDSKKRLERVKSAVKIASPTPRLSEASKASAKNKIMTAASSPRSSTSHSGYHTAQKPLFSPSKYVSYKELMMRVKKAQKLDMALSSYPSEVHHQPLSIASVVSAPTEESHTKDLVVPRKLNKIEQAREDLVQWIFDCNYISTNFLDKKKHSEHPQTNPDFYIIGRVLGKGAFGKVNLCVHKLSEKLVAIKSLHKHYLESEHNNSKLQNEISLLRQLKHKNVIRLYETFSTDSFLLIVIELCGGGDLLSYVRKRRKLTEPVAKVAFKQILDGLSYCHSKGIVHRDIKLDNILLNFYGDIKICDFGVSKKVVKGQKLRERCGTPAYIAPEILREVGYEGTLVDVWSAGVVLYAMLYGNFPFRATNVDELEQLILTGNYTLPAEISEEARDLLSSILNPNPSLRITIPEIYAHPWMQDIDYSLCLFTDEEISSIKKEYDFKERLKDTSVSQESSVFTVHNLDTTENNENGDDLSKSTILAPFNSNEPNEKEFVESVQPLIVSKKVLKFSSKLREVDRQYERDNNSKIDNGVYVQAVPSAHSPRALSTRSTAANTLHSYSSQMDKRVLDRMEKMGFEKSFVSASLNANIHNSATTCYYLLSEN